MPEPAGSLLFCPEFHARRARTIFVGRASGTHYPRSQKKLSVRASLDRARDRPLRTDFRSVAERSGPFRPLPLHPRCVVDLIPIIRVASLTLIRARRRAIAAVAALFAATAAGAQDTRTVVEPKVPAACTVLTAALVPVGDSTLAESDERRLDTPRIQAALDGCAKGRAVVLRPSGNARAFLSGPLVLRAGVALVIDSGAILIASRDPRVYDARPGSCGVVNE